jgi:hypothetical protein
MVWGLGLLMLFGGLIDRVAGAEPGRRFLRRRMR